MILNRVAAIFKVGDQAPYYDGGLVCFIDELAWGKSLEEIISSFTARVFCCIIVDRKMLMLSEKALQPIYDSNLVDTSGMPIGTMRFNSSIKIDFDYLETRLNLPGLVNRLRSTVDIVTPIDGTELQPQDFTDPRDNQHVLPIPDFNSISSGSYTVGSGGNYATWVLALSDLAVLTGNLTLTQISDIVETANVNRTVSLGGFILNMTTDTPHFGNFQKGRLVSANHTANIFQLSSAGTAGTINISRLNIKRLLAPASTSLVMLYFANTAVANSIVNLTDCIFDFNNVLAGGSGKISFLLYSQSGNWSHSWKNIIGKNLTGETGSYAIGATTAALSSVFESMLFYDCVNGINFSATAQTKKNLASFCTANCFNTTGYGTFSKCASSDATGSEAALRSLTFANEFEAADVSRGVAVRVKRGGKCYNSGVVPSIAGNTYGARGNPRPGTRLATYSIGADEAWQSHLRFKS